MAQTRGALRGVQAQAVGTTSAMAGMAGVMGAFAAGGAIVSLINRQEQLSRSMNKSLSIMGDLSDAMRGDLRQAAIDVSRTTRFAATETAEAFFFLASAGLDAEQSLAALPLSAKFAQAGFFDLQRGTDLLTDAQSALGLTVKDAAKNLKNMERVADVLVKANTLANASVEQFSEALTTKAAAAARNAGMEIEEVVAVLAVFADQGLKGADAGTAFTIVLRELMNKAILNQKAFKDFRLEVFRADGSLRKMADIIGDIEDRFDGMSAKTKTQTLLQLGFNQKSIASLKTVLGMSKAMRQYEVEAKASAGITDEVSDNMTDLEKATNKLSSAWQKFSEAMSPVVEFLAWNLENLAALAESLAKALKPVGDLDLPPDATAAQAEAAFQARKAKMDPTGFERFVEGIFGDQAPRPEVGKAFANSMERVEDIQQQFTKDKLEEFRLLEVAVKDAGNVAGPATQALQAFIEEMRKGPGIIKTPFFAALTEKQEESIERLGAEAKRLGLASSATAKQIAEANIAEEQRAEAMKRVGKIVDQTRTPLEIFKMDMAGLDAVFEAGGRGADHASLSAEAFNRRQVQIAEALQKTTPEFKRLQDVLATFPAIIERNRTPIEQLEQGLLRLNEAVAAGLDPEIAVREEARLFKELRGEPKKVPRAESPAALQRGSIAAFSASLKAQQDATVNEQKKTNSLLKQGNKQRELQIAVDLGNIA